MPEIKLLDQQTIDKIAAGEVVERPSSVVKELVENAIDARATAVTVEIKEGGTSLIRITDNGCGIEKDQIPIAFCRHSTSKIRSVEDLLTISSLGFRGEALSSIAAVARVELISKPAGQFTGVRYLIEGGKEISLEEIGAPGGTTFLVKDLFYNTPARRKFLKTAQTEAGYISDLMERMALSHPGISFKFINNGQIRLHTSGNGQLKDIIYHIYGRDIAANLLEISGEFDGFSVTGYIGKPVISRGNRNFESYFINGRYIRSSLIAKTIEDAYRGFLMQHKYPFTVLQLVMDSRGIDVNVHPNKMELRFSDAEHVYDSLLRLIQSALKQRELIPEASVKEEPKETKKAAVLRETAPEPFETKRLEKIRQETLKDSPYEPKYRIPRERPVVADRPRLLSEEARPDHRIIGQLFETYWLVEFDEQFYMIDQHAAHEKVLFERTMAAYRSKEFSSQYVSPPIVLSLTMQEEVLLKQYLPDFEKLGFQIEPFGGREYAVSAVPDNLYGLNAQDLLMELIDGLNAVSGKDAPDTVIEKIASMSCKAAVKGNSRMSRQEAMCLIDELLKLENPYFCPHGRPVIISMSKREIEKKFKRIV